MNIAILTLTPSDNYGGTLQAYALQTVLERMGHSVTILNTPNHRPFSHAIYKKGVAELMRLYLKYVKKSERALRYDDVFLNRQWLINSARMRTFIDEYLHLSAETNYHDLRNGDYDAIVVGSDQVWRPQYIPRRNGMTMADAYLDFAKTWNVKRISYAASFGTDDWEYSWWQERRCRPLLKRFDAVSVREASAVDIVRERFGVEAVHVLDPTMLLTSNDYSILVDRAEDKGLLEKRETTAPYILTYVLDEKPEIRTMIERLSDSLSLNVVQGKSKTMRRETFSIAELDDYVQPSIEWWLRNFRDSQCVITDSFHGTVFSILNRKPFVVLGNEGRGAARFESLLGMFGLRNRLVKAGDDCGEIMSQPIDYDAVYDKLDKYRADGYAFLKDNL